MKPRFLICILAVLILVPLRSMGGGLPSGKRFQSGVSGLGYRWNFCSEGDAVRYVVFAYGPRPREMGEEKSGEWVNVAGASSRNPKATLQLQARERRDLLTSVDQIYQIDRDGQVNTCDERVTAAELHSFIASYPKQYTAQALLEYVHQLRSAVR